jgi:hypothetical protein
LELSFLCLFSSFKIVKPLFFYSILAIALMFLMVRTGTPKKGISEIAKEQRQNREGKLAKY